MKYLVLIAVLLVVYLLWRGKRQASGTAGPRTGKAAPPALPQDMVRCPVCALHLPRAEATPGTAGRLYCSPEHRLLDGNGGGS
jgi:uncharacterized protein